MRCAGEERADNAAPFCEGRRLAKIDGVIFQRCPVHHQQIALRRLYTFLHFVAEITLGLGNRLRDTALDSFVEFSLFAWLDADIGKFQNHGCLRRGWKAGLDYYIFPQALRASPRLRFCFVSHRMKSLQDEPVLCCTNDYAGRSRISIADRVFAWVCTRASLRPRKS